jgi:ubiquinone/menaquinone biosynthesis C-methylase UbiE
MTAPSHWRTHVGQLSFAVTRAAYNSIVKKLSRLQESWNTLAQIDPMWAIVSDPSKKGRKWDPAAFFHLGEAEIEYILNQVASAGIELQRGTALDFGCGLGRLTQALCKHFQKCYGVDISPAMVYQAAEYNRFGSACIYVVNDSPDLRRFQDNVFDFIYSNIVLQHMPPDASRAYIAEFVRLVKPEGLVIFQLPGVLRQAALASPPLNENFAAPGSAHPSHSKEQNTGPLRRARSIWTRLTGSGGAEPRAQKALSDSSNEPRRNGKPPENLEELIEMHGVPKDDVIRLVEESGGRVLQVHEDHSVGPQWPSYRYWVTKR